MEEVIKEEAVKVKNKTKRKLVIKYSIKIIISGILFYWIFKDVKFGEIFSAIKTAKWYILLFAYSLHIIGLYISAVRWQLLLRTQNVNSKIFYLLKSSLVGIFFNNFLPSTVGGDTVRAYDSWRLGKNKADAVTVVFIDRFLGLLALLLFAIAGVFFANQITSKVSFIYLWVAAAVVLTIIIIIMIFFPNKKIFIWLYKLPFINKISGKLEKLSNSFWAFRNRKKELVIALLLSLLLQVNVVFYYFLISVSLNFGIPFYNFFLIIPLSIFIMMLPVSVNGIGIRENVFFFFFSIFAITKPAAIAFAWIDLSFILIQGLIGGIVYALRK